MASSSVVKSKELPARKGHKITAYLNLRAPNWIALQGAPLMTVTGFYRGWPWISSAERTHEKQYPSLLKTAWHSALSSTADHMHFLPLSKWHKSILYTFKMYIWTRKHTLSGFHILPLFFTLTAGDQACHSAVSVFCHITRHEESSLPFLTFESPGWERRKQHVPEVAFWGGRDGGNGRAYQETAFYCTSWKMLL